MAAVKRIKTKYPGVYYRMAERIGMSGQERVYYIVFKQNNKVIEEKAGRQFADDMSASRASSIRAERIERKRSSRKEIREAAQAAKDAEATRCTIEKLWNQYQAVADERKSKVADENRYRLYLQTQFAQKVPEDITTLDIDNLRQKLFKSGKSPQTVKHGLALLRRIINFGVKKGLCPAPDPSKLHFEMPTVDNQKTENMTSEQLRRYLAVLDKEPDQNAASFLRLALATGMRKSALMALRWDDIDFETGFITLRGDVAKKGKTERIPLSKVAEGILRQVDKTGSLYVFPGKDCGPRKEFRKIAERVKKNAGLPDDFRPLHGLRHVFASLLASSGQVDLYTLQKLLTHGSPQMTQRYAHLADEALHRAVAVIDKFVVNNSSESTNASSK